MSAGGLHRRGEQEALACATVAGQEPSDSQYRFKTGIELINVTATVTATARTHRRSAIHDELPFGGGARALAPARACPSCLIVNGSIFAHRDVPPRPSITPDGPWTLRDEPPLERRRDDGLATRRASVWSGAGPTGSLRDEPPYGAGPGRRAHYATSLRMERGRADGLSTQT